MGQKQSRGSVSQGQSSSALKHQPSSSAPHDKKSVTISEQDVKVEDREPNPESPSHLSGVCCVCCVHMCSCLFVLFGVVGIADEDEEFEVEPGDDWVPFDPRSPRAVKVCISSCSLFCCSLFVYAVGFGYVYTCVGCCVQAYVFPWISEDWQKILSEQNFRIFPKMGTLFIVSFSFVCRYLLCVRCVDCVFVTTKQRKYLG